MKDFLETTPGRVLLLLVVLVVWGVNAIQFSGAFGGEEMVAKQIEDDIDVSTLSASQGKDFVYRKTERDPFGTVRQAVQKATQKPDNVEPYQRPRIAVLGVMDKTIMVVDETRTIIVVKEAEVFNGITVKSITPDSVIFEHEHKSFVIKVKS